MNVLFIIINNIMIINLNNFIIMYVLCMYPTNKINTYIYIYDISIS